MRASYKRFSVITGFAILLAVLIGNGFVIRRELGVQVEDENWVSHTQQVLLQLGIIESLITDAETGQRGYLYTGEPRYLAPYDRAVGNVSSAIDRVAALSADNEQQQARIPKLRSLSKQKLDELAATIALYRSGQQAEARAIVLSDRGLHLMEDIRSLIGEMRQEETSLQAVRSQTYFKSVRITVACIYVASILAGLGLLALAAFVLHEITLRERHASEIKQREEWFRVTLTSIGDGVIATDKRGSVIFVNPVAERLTGRLLSESKGLAVTEVFPIYNERTRERVENPVQKVMALGQVIGLANHTVLERPDGTLIPIEDSAAPIRDDQGRLVGVVLVFRDATAERSSQELIRKTEKIAAAARLAATVAHEINNPLEAVSNLIFLAKARAGIPAEAIADLTLAEEELARVSHVTRQTLGFYRESTIADSVDMATLVDSVLKLYSNKLKTKNIIVERDFSLCSPLHGWVGELRQAVSNLISNAVDAMSPNGILRVSIASVKHGDAPALQLRVEDDGIGIAPEHMERVFEPFFTTKKDVGTGLGLFVSKQIIERHGGSIEVKSSRDNGSRGTVFSIVLPCSAGETLSAAKSA